jgi:predicted SAM-dependent methyltransferase
VKTYLNLGCGERIHPDWINIDMTASQPNVVAHDLVAGVPFEAESADVVYHAAVFEHIRRKDVAKFLREIHRVLKPGGIIRIGVPDLERICHTYLEKLEAALTGEKQAANDYDWMMLEMLDQMVRESSGGEMINYLRREPLSNECFIFERIGDEGRKLVAAIRRGGATKRPERPSFYRGAGAVARMLRDRLLTLLAGRDAPRALAIGRFRLSGEVHQWMYDRFSLARELVAADFREPKICSASQSSIPDWERFHLDTQPDGTVNKPDLLFMEAIKPHRYDND